MFSFRRRDFDRQKADAVFDYFTEEADPLLSAAQLSLEVAVLKVLHPEWSSARTVFTAAWNVTKGKVHTALDLVGLVPGFGEGADLVNGILYVIEGDKANAKISFAASIPGIGWAATGAKYGIILLKVGKQVKKLRISRSGNFYIFSHNSSNAFRKILQITNPDIRAHHIIPKEFWSHPAIQKAAQAKNNPFHMNHKNNGWPIPRDFHSGSHPNYSDQIRSFLNDLQRQNLSFEELAKKLKKKQDDIINVLKISPATKIDEIVIP